MQGIIDVHNHILFGVDDGAKDIDESLKLIDMEYSQGVRKIILTPHYYPGLFQAGHKVIHENYETLCGAAKKRYSDLQLYLGQEIMYTEDITELLDAGSIYTMAGSRYVLIEFRVGVEYAELERCVKKVLNGGYIPILAHCERYRCLADSIPNIRHLVDTGAYIQVNASSVLLFSTKKFVKKLIDADCLHFIATDAHNTKKRGVHFDRALKYVRKKYGKEYVQWLVNENPQKVIGKEYI